jgi:hypothetical protein
MNSKEDLLRSYSNCIDRFARKRSRYLSKSKRTGTVKLAVFFGNFIVSYLVYSYLSRGYALVIFVLLLIVFLLLADYHNKLINAIFRIDKWIEVKKQYIARLNIEWDKITPSFFNPDSGHPFESDLGITGERSLHRLINLSFNAEGAGMLKKWLCNMGPEKDIIYKRQNLIKELLTQSKLRDKIVFYSLLMSGSKKSEMPDSYLHKPYEIRYYKRIFNILFVLAISNIVLFLLSFYTGIWGVWCITLLIYSAIALFNNKIISGMDGRTEFLNEYAGKYYQAFSFLENYSYKKNSYLKQYMAPFLEGEKPGYIIKKLDRTILALSFVQNPFLGFIVNIVLPYSFFFACRLEDIREAIKLNMPVWKEKWAETEALNSMAVYANLNKEYCFPVISENSCKYEVKQAGHPLIHYKNNRRNDFIIQGAGRVDILTGSNMSGKSTFLKTVGANAVLAYAGCVVNAQYMELSIFKVFTCINIIDSVTDGISYFYAEVKRLKMLKDIIDSNGAEPVLFLIDEIFKGTNNIERLIGSRNFIIYLSKNKCTGLVTSHDIELAKLENENRNISNYHFREDVENELMVFDYKLRTGPSPTTNALKIMKFGGLPFE